MGLASAEHIHNSQERWAAVVHLAIYFSNASTLSDPQALCIGKYFP